MTGSLAERLRAIADAGWTEVWSEHARCAIREAAAALSAPQTSDDFRKRFRASLIGNRCTSPDGTMIHEAADKVVELAFALSAQQPEGWQMAIEAAEKAIPSNWCDPLLTGPDNVLPENFACPEIERLLNALRARIRSLPAPPNVQEGWDMDSCRCPGWRLATGFLGHKSVRAAMLVFSFISIHRQKIHPLALPSRPSEHLTDDGGARFHRSMSDRTKRLADDKRIQERFAAVPIRKAREPLHEVPVGLSPQELSRLDDWISRQTGSPARSDAIRMLVTQALESYDLANRTKRK